ncbi:unnamed protein product [Lactuca virosa]|uniref:EF-hand domain-containing protein n=1 Tax=Lactuca virosa TaxID=75947 RepID=A0AAU9MTS9_9ASTR|nr:unnamed protein product [Lactuca virosa]CAH1447610.1 unnamed protein product [Lactuca virosa]CAH1454626.1 unnamed protein product [Lactuca virosa]
MPRADPKKRPTVADVVADVLTTKNPIDDEFLDRMKHFRAMNKFQRFALKVIVDILPGELEGLKAMFHNMDTDEDKVITREELEKSLADTDQNGLIDYNEFITAMMNFRRMYKEEHLLKAFQKFDKDNNK